MKEEKWVDIPKYEGLYQISSEGQVKSLRKQRSGTDLFLKEKILKPSYNKQEDYYQISLTKNYKNRSFALHILVANIFLPNPNRYKFINHKNRDVSDNRVENLEWVKSHPANPINVALRVINKLYEKYGWSVEEISELTESSTSNIKTVLGIPL